MAYSKIVITQGVVSGAAGVARKDLDLYSVASEEIVFSNDTDGDVGVQSWEWTLVERPLDSTATLSGVTSASATLEADVYGRYIVSLRVNGLGDGTNGYSETVASCSFLSLGTLPSGDVLGDWNLPAFSEGTLANWNANSKGAQPEVFRMWRQIREIVLPQYASNLGLRISVEQPPNLTDRTDLSSPQVSGYTFPIDMSDYPWVNTARFFATFNREGTSGTSHVELYDVTNSVIVTSSEITTAQTGPTYKECTTALTIGSSSGNLRDDGSTIYSVRIWITGGTPTTDYVNLFNSGVVLRAQ